MSVMVCKEKKNYILLFFVIMIYISLRSRFFKLRFIILGLFLCDLWRIFMNRRRKDVVFFVVGLNFSVRD